LLEQNENSALHERRRGEIEKRPMVCALSRRSENRHKPDLINLVDYAESTCSTKLCLLHHFFCRRLFPTLARKNDSLNGEWLQNVPSLSVKRDPVDVNTMFFDHCVHHDPH
jgi:hypothetical protein